MNENGTNPHLFLSPLLYHIIYINPNLKRKFYLWYMLITKYSRTTKLESDTHFTQKHCSPFSRAIDCLIISFLKVEES